MLTLADTIVFILQQRALKPITIAKINKLNDMASDLYEKF